MSADNFYIVKGNKVWQGFASDQISAMEKAELEFYKQMTKKSPIFEGETFEEASRWAHNEYAEYGVWWEEE